MLKLSMSGFLLKPLTDEGLLNPGPSLPNIFLLKKKFQSVKQLFSHTCCQLPTLVFAVSVCFQQTTLSMHSVKQLPEFKTV